MARKKKAKILFIGNSHTYYHDLPAWVALMAKEEGYECDVTMLAHGGWYLHQHVEESVQEIMNSVNRKLAEDIDALYAPVGESWWPYKASWPDIEMYDEDGAHASERGIEFAAKIIWSTIETDFSHGK